MPTYVYRREDGSTFEIEQRITEDALEVCPETGQKVKRVITGTAGLIFKGSGFYLTDYARKNGASSTDSTASKSDGGASEATSKDTKTETTKSESTGASSDKSGKSGKSDKAAA